LPTCQYCKEEITDDFILANEMHFHKDHFYCGSCGDVIPNAEYYLLNNKLICEKCHVADAAENTIKEVEQEEDTQKEYYSAAELRGKALPPSIDLTKKEVNEIN
jgi:LIM domain